MNTQQRCRQLQHWCAQHQYQVATAESCTGGLLAAAITTEPGSSVYFGYGFVTYSNRAKQDLLAVNPATLQQYGAVSSETALEMALGALQISHADYSIAITGIAGPNSDLSAKPLGLVYFACATKGGITVSERAEFTGDRSAVRDQSVNFALVTLYQFMQQNHR